MNPGIYNISNEEYHAAPGISSSGLSVIATRTPAHYLAGRSTPRKETPAMAVGTRLHAALLEPQEFDNRYAEIQPHDKRTKEGKAYWEKWQADNAGKIPLTPDERDYTRRLVDRLHADEDVRALLLPGYKERSVFATDPETGVLVKCRPDNDIVSGRWLVDLKSTEDASAEAFMWSAYRYGYHRQAAFYLDVCGWQDPSAIPEDFYFIVFEKEPPFAFRVLRASPRFLMRGREAYRAALDTYAECVSSNVWPDYARGVGTLDLPEVIHKRLDAADNDEIMEIGYVE